MRNVAAFAPAKINLYLHVIGRRPDGFHLLDSLVGFADIGDRVTASPAPSLGLTVAGPEAAALAGIGADNLVTRAARAFAELVGERRGAALRLEKNLPVAAGIGGGSADAAATIRALAALWGVQIDDRVIALAASLGADVPACLAGRPAWVGGIGERIEPAVDLPEFGIVLANPRIPLPTPDVFRARTGTFSEPARFRPIPSDPQALAEMLTTRRNELTEAATGLVPEIAAVLGRLAALPGALLARMSGSGATCFALFAERKAAVAARSTLAADRPSWWSAAGVVVSPQARLFETIS